jgi:RiboL-PSP-HEPN
VTTTSLATAREDFHQDLERAEHLLRLVKSFREFGTSSPPAQMSDGSVEWAEALNLAEAAPKVRTDLPLLSGSLLLYVCGRFEYFVRELIVALADDMAANVQNYSDLPERLRTELELRTLEVAQNPRKYGYEPNHARQCLVLHASNLSATSGPTSASITISSRVLTITDANMNSRMLADLFKRVNIVDLWSDLGKQAPLKAKLGKAGDKECTGEAVSLLDEMMRDRNSIAHPSGSFSFPDPDQVLESVDFLKTLSVVLVDVVQVPRK